MNEFIRENKLATLLVGTLALFVFGFGFWTVFSKAPIQTILVTYQNETIDTIEIPIRTPVLDRSCLIDRFNGKHFVCGVRSIKILKDGN